MSQQQRVSTTSHRYDGSEWSMLDSFTFMVGPNEERLSYLKQKDVTDYHSSKKQPAKTATSERKD